MIDFDLCFSGGKPLGGAALLRSVDSRINEMSMSGFAADNPRIQYTTHVQYTAAMQNLDRIAASKVFTDKAMITGSEAKAYYLQELFNAVHANQALQMNATHANDILRQMGHKFEDKDFVMYDAYLEEEEALALMRLDALYCGNSNEYQYMDNKPFFIELNDGRFDLFVVPTPSNFVPLGGKPGFVPLSMLMQATLSFGRPKDFAWYQYITELLIMYRHRNHDMHPDWVNLFPRVRNLADYVTSGVVINSLYNSFNP